MRLTHLLLWCRGKCRGDRRHSVVLDRRGVSRQTRATLHAAPSHVRPLQGARSPKDPTGNEDTRAAHRYNATHTDERTSGTGGREIAKRQIGCQGALSAVTVDIDTVSQSHILRSQTPACATTQRVKTSNVEIQVEIGDISARPSFTTQRGTYFASRPRLIVIT